MPQGFDQVVNKPIGRNAWRDGKGQWGGEILGNIAGNHVIDDRSDNNIGNGRRITGAEILGRDRPIDKPRN